MFSRQADIFFEQPSSNRRSPGEFGTLYRLRRDIFFCMGTDPSTQHTIPYAALWPGIMAIMAGIDLLAKFYEGCDQINKAGPRFQTFINRYFKPLSPGDQETVHHLRNSLLHSFGLFSEARNGKKYRFVLDQYVGHSSRHLTLIIMLLTSVNYIGGLRAPCLSIKVILRIAQRCKGIFPPCFQNMAQLQ
jgi:hypothetical protein